MPAVVFYISGHGFGHASREIEILQALHARRPDLTLIIRSAVSASLLDRSLRIPHVRLPGACDAGVLQHDSVTHDDAGTVREAVAFQQSFSTRIAEEVLRLAPYDVRLIVGDIPPLAFEVAERLGVPSVAIANFTWDWIYEWYPEALRQAPDLPDAIRASYAKATLALRLPIAPAFTQFAHTEDVPFVARPARHSRAATRAALNLPDDARVLLLSFGGYGLPRLDVASLDCLDDWHVVATDRVFDTLPDHPRLRFVTERELMGAVQYPDLVGASDVVATKPGYGIVSECAANGVAMLYTSRGHFREYDLMVDVMPHYIRTRFIDHQDLFGGRWRDALDRLLSLPSPPRPRTDGAAVIADRLLTFLAHTPPPTTTAAD
jgi:L-arabinokinase